MNAIKEENKLLTEALKKAEEARSNLSLQVNKLLFEKTALQLFNTELSTSYNNYKYAHFLIIYIISIHQNTIRFFAPFRTHERVERFLK